MAKTADVTFAAGAAAGLDGMLGDLTDQLFAAGIDLNNLGAGTGAEDAQILTLAYILVKALRLRQRATPHSTTTPAATLALDRCFGSYIGGVSAKCFQILASSIEPVYEEFRAAFNAIDDVADTVFPAGYGDLGPKGGPTH